MIMRSLYPPLPPLGANYQLSYIQICNFVLYVVFCILYLNVLKIIKNFWSLGYHKYSWGHDTGCSVLIVHNPKLLSFELLNLLFIAFLLFLSA